MKTLALAAMLTTGMAATAQASVITFGGIGGHGTTVTAVSTTDGLITAQVSATGGAGEARIFNTKLSGTADPDLEGPFTHDTDPTKTRNAGKVLIVQEADFQASDVADDNRSGGTITFNFLRRVSFKGFTIIDDALITVTSDTGVTRTREVDTDGAFAGFGFGSAFANVKSLTFDFNGHSGAIDRLRFDTPVVIPVPASMPLLMAGLGGLAFLGRRRKKV